MEKAKDYYKILGVNKNATKEQIKEAYWSLAKKYHPDRNKSDDATEKFKEVNEAYSFLIHALHETFPEDETKGCHYHISPHKGKLNKCRFCGKFFCEKHIIPHPSFSFRKKVKLGIPDNIHLCLDCPPCPYCMNESKHPEPYKDPYIFGKTEDWDPPYQCHICKKWVTIDTRHPWQHDCKCPRCNKSTTKENWHFTLHDCTPKPIKPEPEPPKPEGPKPPKEKDSKVFVSKVFDASFDVQLNENVRSSLRSLRKEILQNKRIKEHEIQKMLNILIIILKNNSFEKKLDNACYKFVKKIYEVYSIDVFSYWNDIYKEAKKKSTKPPKPKPSKIKPIYYVFGLALLLLIGLLFYLTSATVTIQELKNISNAKTVTSLENISNKISFSEYLNDIYASDKQKVTLNGFLERSIEGDGNMGVHVFSIVDDYNNKVLLDGYYNELKKYLPDFGKTKELYSVQGIFKREYKTLKLNVENINLYKREPAKQIEVKNVVSYTEQITIKRTSPKYPLVRNLVFKLIGKEILCEDDTKINSCSNEKPLYCSINGLKEEPQKCGCLSGERIYKNQCIIEVKCSDETIEPDCSPKLKMQCIGGNFIYNPNKCGCPDGYVKRGDNCIKTCEDGTAYDECSDDKPLYCDDGILVNKASTCGCPYGSKFRQSGDICLDLTKPTINSIEEKIHGLINIEREKYDLSKLSWNDKIALAARKHSEDMVNRDYFSHDSPEGYDFSWRYSQVGFSCDIYAGNYIYKGAENLHQGWTYGAIQYVNGVESNREWLTPDEIAKSAVEGWMNSPGHRQNILTSYWKSEGIGVAVSNDGKVLATQNFC
ncbi:DnaJ domain-containing protein [Candidatus Woesearchaeota archaeon]|nr:DnaJ domain-containing protein [Candidatus Woesearchaeota archaeon]